MKEKTPLGLFVKSVIVAACVQVALLFFTYHFLVPSGGKEYVFSISFAIFILISFVGYRINKKVRDYKYMDGTKFFITVLFSVLIFLLGFVIVGVVIRNLMMGIMLLPFYFGFILQLSMLFRCKCKGHSNSILFIGKEIIFPGEEKTVCLWKSFVGLEENMKEEFFYRIHRYSIKIKIYNFNNYLEGKELFRRSLRVIKNYEKYVYGFLKRLEKKEEDAKFIMIDGSSDTLELQKWYLLDEIGEHIGKHSMRIGVLAALGVSILIESRKEIEIPDYSYVE